MKKLTKTEVERLVQLAKQTRTFAFSHRSKHKIGASVLLEGGTAFGGCNIESVISGLGECAERCAINNAVAHGHYAIRAVCCVDTKLTPPCGACLQYLQLFSQVTGKDIEVIMADLKGNMKRTTLHALLPLAYETHHNLSTIRSYAKRR